MRRLVASISLAIAAIGCGGAAKKQAMEDQESFACKDRIVSYMATGHMAADEIGVQMDCAVAGPRILRWQVDKAGTRIEDARGITPSEFERVWREIDGTGWVNLSDCANGTGEPRDPTYVFDIKDDQNQASFSCQSREMPYPYNGIVDPLDVAAASGRGQLGDER